MNGNFCVTVAIRRLGTNLSAVLLISCVTHKDCVATAASPPWSGASSAGSSGRHVKRLPTQVVQRVLVVTCHKETLGQVAIAVEQSESRRFPRFVEYSFQLCNLKRQQKSNISSALGWMFNFSASKFTLKIYSLIRFPLVRRPEQSINNENIRSH